MNSSDRINHNTDPQAQKEAPTCHTITDLFHPEESKDSESPLMFGSWQVVGKF